MNEKRPPNRWFVLLAGVVAVLAIVCVAFVALTHRLPGEAGESSPHLTLTKPEPGNLTYFVLVYDNTVSANKVKELKAELVNLKGKYDEYGTFAEINLSDPDWRAQLSADLQERLKDRKFDTVPGYLGIKFINSNGWRATLSQWHAGTNVKKGQMESFFIQIYKTGF